MRGGLRRLATRLRQPNVEPNDGRRGGRTVVNNVPLVRASRLRTWPRVRMGVSVISTPQVELSQLFRQVA